MESQEVNHFILLEPTFQRTLRIWWAWFWRWALLGGIPVALAYSADYYNTHSSQHSGLLAVVVFLAVVGCPYWAYTYSFRQIFDKSLGGVRIRLQPLSPAVAANQPQTFLAPTRLLTLKIRKKWTRRSLRWGLGLLITLLLLVHYVGNERIKGQQAPTGTASVELMIGSLLIAAFCGAFLGWLVGTAFELKSIFKGDFGEFRVCLTSEPYPGQQE